MGGCPYGAIALMSLILLRGLKATGVVTGECSSAALWPFAACRRRLVSPLSILLFHRMKWQSEENVGLSEASEWARHFGQLETDMDLLLADLFKAAPEKIAPWIHEGRYVTGRELAEAGLAELIELKPLDVAAAMAIDGERVVPGSRIAARPWPASSKSASAPGNIPTAPKPPWRPSTWSSNWKTSCRSFVRTAS